MTTIKTLKDLPGIADDLKRQRFYGEIRLSFRNGELHRVVTEQSHIIQEPNPDERPRNSR